jgi:hypothetical protein
MAWLDSYEILRSDKIHNILSRLMMVVATILLAGCVTLSDPEASQEYRSDIVSTLTPGIEVGQSFMAERCCLNSIQLYFQPNTQFSESPATLSITLHPSINNSSELFSAKVLVKNIPSTGIITLPLTVPTREVEQSYYLNLSTDTGELAIMGRNEDAYYPGTAHIQGQPRNADIAFRLTYEYDIEGVMRDALGLVRKSWLLIPLAAILFLPGWVLVNTQKTLKILPSWEKLALCGGMSIATLPVLMLWTSTLNISWSRLFWIALLAALGVLAVWQARRINFQASLQYFIEIKPKLFVSVGIGFVLFVCLLVRFFMVRDLELPSWVDSVHHAILTRIIQETGKYPETYEPYLSTNTASYHPGFHMLSAGFSLITNIPTAEAMLLFGQVLNLMAVFSLVLMCWIFFEKSTIGLFAALFAGLFSAMPAYYTSWGRYTQLTALILLPVSLFLLKSSLDQNLSMRNPFDKKIIFLEVFTAISIAGSFLINYRSLAFLGCLILAWLLIRYLTNIRNISELGKSDLPRGLFILSGSILLLLPWIPKTIETLIVPSFSWSATTTKIFYDFSWAYLTPVLGKYLLGLSVLGIVWGLFKRDTFPLIMILWTLGMLLLANIGVFGLPGTGFINNTSVAILLYIPLSVSSGYIIGTIILGWYSFVKEKWQIYIIYLVGILVVFLCFIGARAILPVLNPTTVLYRQADQAALDWVKQYIPAQETILINPFVWGYGLYAGSDGGYWITPQTGRATMPPAILEGLGNSLDAIQETSQFLDLVVENRYSADSLYDLLMEEGIRYIFLGARPGILSAQTYLNSSMFEVVYSHRGAWVFKLIE